MRLRTLLAFLVLFLPDPVPAQTRVSEIEAERDRKSAQLAPEATTLSEGFFGRLFQRDKVDRMLGRVEGLRLGFGGGFTGSGFGLGADYEIYNRARTMSFYGGVRGSIRKYYRFDAGLRFPYLLGGRGFASLDLQRIYAPRVEYYGPGNDSREEDRTSYLLERNSLAGSLGIRLTRRLSIGLEGGGLGINIGRGQNPDFPSIEQRFLPSMTPAVNEQPHHILAGGFLRWDTRRNPGAPRSGQSFRAQYTHYSDVKLSRYSFRQFELDLQQYIPLFNERRVIALRGYGMFADPDHGNQIPFFLQPTFGGPRFGRGFHRFRYYDQNMFALTAEYRWEVASGLDMAVFWDGGRVFHLAKDLTLQNMRHSVGLGFRAHTREQMLVRIDTGLSREGVQVWLRFDNIF